MCVRKAIANAVAVLFTTAFTTIAGTPIPESSPRIVMIGASVSAGFTESELLGGPKTAQYRLNHYLDAALAVPHEPITNLARTMFFMAPEMEGRRQIELATQLKPTLVVGADFLFWFCYGDLPENDRLTRFEKGLKFLEMVQCPVVLGDIPDASIAVTTGMLTREQVPALKTISAANERLKDWAAKHSQVTIVGISNFLHHALANQAITIRNQIFPAGTTRALLQEDKLHASGRGCAVLALAICDAASPALSTNQVRWNANEVFRLGYNASQISTNTSAKSLAAPGR